MPDVTRIIEEGEALKLWRDTPVPALDPTVYAGMEPTVLTLDGEPIAAVCRLPDETIPGLRRAVIDYPIDVVVRGAGIRNRAKVFGYVAANAILQRSSCRVCSGATDAPAAHATICDAGAVLASLLASAVPGQYRVNRDAIEAVRPSWRLPGGLWTSGVVNLTSTLPYHRDRNNLDAWSAMPVLRRHMTGGHLHLPELALLNGDPVVVACADGDVLFFNGQRFMHGVTPMRRRRPDGYRYSIVYYPVKKMCACLDPAEEIARARRRRTSQEDTLIERQRANGMLNQPAVEGMSFIRRRFRDDYDPEDLEVH